MSRLVKYRKKGEDGGNRGSYVLHLVKETPTKKYYY